LYRCFIVGRKPTAKEKGWFDRVKNSLDACIEATKVGMKSLIGGGFDAFGQLEVHSWENVFVVAGTKASLLSFFLGIVKLRSRPYIDLWLKPFWGKFLEVRMCITSKAGLIIRLAISGFFLHGHIQPIIPLVFVIQLRNCRNRK